MEGWNNGMVEWNIGILDCFNDYGSFFHHSNIPVSSHCTIPVFHYSSLKRSRQGDIKGAALVDGTCHGNVPAMSSGNGPGQAQAQPCSRLGSTLIAAVESSENPV